MGYDCAKNEAAKARLEPLLIKFVSEAWRKTTARAMPGFVYLFSGGGIYKIGKAVDVRERLGYVNVSAPFPVRIAHSIHTDHMDQLEGLFHSCFKAAGMHVYNEWFDLDVEAVELIVGLGAEVNQSQFEEVFATIRRRVAALAPVLTGE